MKVPQVYVETRRSNTGETNEFLTAMSLPSDGHWQDVECIVSGLAESDCYAMSSVIVHYSTVAGVVAGFLIRDLNH